MRPPAFKKIAIDAKSDKLQENVQRKMDIYDNLPVFMGRYLDLNGSNVIALTTTATNFEHKLGREPEGFLVLYTDANATIWWDRTGSEDRSLFLRLDSSATVNAKIWVF